MIMAGKNGKTVTRLPIPNTNRLVVRAAENPRQIVRMEFYRPDIVQMTAESIQYVFKVPHFDFIIISSARKHGMSRMKVDCANGTIVFFESIQQCPNSVVP
jgi:hypothetical protein